MVIQQEVKTNLILNMGSTIRHRNQSSTEIKNTYLDQRIKVIFPFICFAWSLSFGFLTDTIDFERFYTKVKLKKYDIIGNWLLLSVNADLKGWTISQATKEAKGRIIMHLISLNHAFSWCKSEAVFTHLFNCLWVDFHLLSLAGFNILKAAQDTFEHIGLKKKGKGKSAIALQVNESVSTFAVSLPLPSCLLWRWKPGTACPRALNRSLLILHWKGDNSIYSEQYTNVGSR